MSGEDANLATLVRFSRSVARLAQVEGDKSPRKLDVRRTFEKPDISTRSYAAPSVWIALR